MRWCGSTSIGRWPSASAEPVGAERPRSVEAITSSKPPKSSTVHRRSLLLLSLATWQRVIWAAPADESPVKIAGVAFDRRALVAGTELRLNGVGVRGWFKAYAAGLYLPSPAASAAEVEAMAGPKRLQLRMRFEIPAGEFVKALRTGLTRNASPEALPRLSARMERFASTIEALGTVHDGDLVNLDFEPDRGLVFSVNGTLRGSPLAGDDFYTALLRAFIGEKPYDDKLKSGLLGQHA